MNQSINDLWIDSNPTTYQSSSSMRALSDATKDTTWILSIFDQYANTHTNNITHGYVAGIAESRNERQAQNPE
jgi:hypothetical protein